jgi:hypothetical protein
LLLLLLVSGQLLPQLPGQLSADSTAAERWLLGASADYGAAGDLLRGLGLFNVLHSMLLQLLLTVLTLVLCVYLGDMVAVALQYRQLPTLLTQSTGEPGEPLPLQTAQKLYRQRLASTVPLDEMVSQLQSDLSTRYEHVISAVTPNADNAEQETRLLATRALRWAAVRLVLMAGLLLAVLTVWRIVIAGWEVSAPVLAPGGEYHLASHGIVLNYHVPTTLQEAGPQLQVQSGGQQLILPAAERVTASVGAVDVVARPSAPGLYVMTSDGKRALARAGQSETVAGVGLTFPAPGSEESMILPAEAIGLRIVRLGAEVAAESGAGYLLEVYRGEESQPEKRVDIGAKPVESVVLNDKGLTLRFVQMPGLAVEVRYLPGVWLLWLALLLVLLGALGFWFRPAFALVQVAPWAGEQTVVTLQSDEAAALAALDQQIAKAETPA